MTFSAPPDLLCGGPADRRQTERVADRPVLHLLDMSTCRTVAAFASDMGL
jgi:hypothetical protein